MEESCICTVVTDQLPKMTFIYPEACNILCESQEIKELRGSYLKAGVIPVWERDRATARCGRDGQGPHPALLS